MYATVTFTDLLPDLLVVFQDAVGNGDVGFVRLRVELEVVELEEDTHFVDGRKFGVDAGADFVGVEDEGALADLRTRNGANLVGEDQGAGVEGFFFVERDPEGGIDGADVAVLRVFEHDVKAIEAGAQRNGPLIDGRQVHGGLKKRFGKIGGDYLFKGVNNAAAERGDAAVEIERGGLDAVFAFEA